MDAALELVRRLGPARLAAMGAVTLALVGFFAFVIMRVSQPAMAVLYSDLSFQDATNIVRDLEAKGIRYETRGDGQTILAPADVVGKLRMEFAGKGMPTGGGVGYEIFDKGDAFSSTSFVQGINQLRALEGELSRTIRSLSRVQAARVHLVIPERKLFERDREPPSASIVLKLAGDLDVTQVRAVRHLAASAVEGLKPERISIVDERGRLLADGAQADALTVGLDEKQTAIERRLKAQVEEIVAGIVGPGRARVQVAAEIDAKRVEVRSETFDPESRVVRSTQTRTENQQTNEAQNTVSIGNELPGAGAQPPPPQASRDASTKNEEIVNYEISRSTQTEVTEGGRLKRLSVAVLVDGVYVPGQDGQTTYEPRPREELDRIAALVRTAIGFDGQRGDQLEVVNLRFAEGPPVVEGKDESVLASLLNFTKDDLVRLAELVVLGLLTLIVFLTVVRPLVKRVLAPEALRKALPAPAEPAGGDGGETGQSAGALESQAMRMLDIARINGQVQAQSIEKVGELVKNNPKETASILREWIHESA